MTHNLLGNCFDPDAAFDDHGRLQSCVDHQQPRGACSECSDCEACFAEAYVGGDYDDYYYEVYENDGDDVHL